MAYIGPEPAESFTSFATQEFSTSATTSYTLDHAVTNENEIALFVNNVRQQPGSGKAYTATGTALTLSAATASTDTMYCVFLGRALQTVTPATNSITAAMVGNDLISGKDALTSAPADTDEFLVSDAGTLKRIDFSHLKTGITEADMFRLTADITGANADITSNLERPDNSSFEKIGTGMSESSGIFTFPSTGLYLIIATGTFLFNSSDLIAALEANVTTNNSSYADIFQVQAGYEGSNSKYETNTNSGFINVTDTSNVKIKFTTASFGGNTLLKGDTDYNKTNFTFIRLGDSQ
jgi:hypothetical protein